MIHIVNGDSLAMKMKNFNGEVIPWREMYDYGPLVSEDTHKLFLKRRAAFFEEKVGIPSALFIENDRKQHQWLDHLPRDSEIILWFEHDRYDQTMLLYLLNALSTKGFHNLSMVTINQFPEIDPFYGLVQLSSQQLLDLYHQQKQRITEAQLREAHAGWNAYTSTNPLDIEACLPLLKGKLPFLKKALETHLSYFPSVQNGLNEVENLIFQFINQGTHSFVEIFQYISKHRKDDGLSDLHLAAMLGSLLSGEFPLLKADAPLPNFKNPVPNSNLSLTSFGLDVLNGKRDRFDFIGIDWWLGGVHLTSAQWRWNQNSLIKVAR